LEEPDQVERIPSTIRVEKEKTLAQEVGVQHADYVMVREGAVVGPLDSKYRGPYKVMLRDKKKLLLEIGASRQWISVDRLKPWKGTTPADPVEPPKRGRPPKKSPQ
jgi:putative hemolysin